MLFVERDWPFPRTCMKNTCTLSGSQKCIKGMEKSACSLAESSGKRPCPLRKRFHFLFILLIYFKIEYFTYYILSKKTLKIRYNPLTSDT